MDSRIPGSAIKLWGAQKPVVPSSDIFERPAVETRADKARQFYFDEKFAGCTYAQNLAKANIKKDETDGTLDQEGRFRAFKLDHDSKNAQLECFELFPLATRTANDSGSVLHYEGYRLFLTLKDFVEKHPFEHEGIMRIGIDCVRDRLTEIEHYKLNAILVVCLGNNGRRLSQWEQLQLEKAVENLTLPYFRQERSIPKQGNRIP